MTAKEIVEAIRLAAGAEGIRQIFLVGCGGSMAGLYPAWYLLSREAKI